MTTTNVRVGKSRIGGRGIFALRNFRKGQTIMVDPVIPITQQDLKVILGTGLAHYYFQWGEDWDEGCIDVGPGSLINHSYAPNCDWKTDLTSLTIAWRATRAIQKGEELLFNYSGPVDEKLWFQVLEY